MRKHLILLLLLSLTLLAGCLGYNLEGRGSNLPEYIKVVGIPTLENKTADHTLSQIVTEAIITEFVKRGDFELSSSVTGVDAVLTGEMTTYRLSPMAINENGEPTSILVIIGANLQFKDVQQDVIIWEQTNYQFSQNYQLSELGADFINMESEAIREASKAFASKLVNSILTGF
jgi:hypothetical protein